MVRRKPWRQVELPLHDGGGWAIWRNNRTVACSGMFEVTSFIDRSPAPNLLLIGKPGATQFVLPVHVAQLRARILRTFKRNSRNYIAGFSGLSIPFFILGAWFNSLESINLANLSLLVAVLLFTDYYRCLRSEDGISERTLFGFWLCTDKSVRNGFVFWVLLGITAGGSQLLLQKLLGGMKALFSAYGVMYPSVRAGEIWRLALGPFFHYTLTHFFLNFALLVIIGTFAWAVRGRMSVAVFVLGNIGGAFAQLTWGEQLFDNYGGVSAGVYALFGFVIASGVLDRKLLPKGIGLYLTGLAVVGMLASQVLSEEAASVAHLAGAAIGIVAACAYLFESENA